MPTNAQDFAKTVLAAFVANGNTTDGMVKAAGGPSDTYMSSLRRAAEGEPMRKLRSDTALRIDAAAGWKPGSANEFWHTGQLPSRHDSRKAAPAALAAIDEVSSSASRDADGSFHGLVTSVATLPDGQSRMEIHYWPGPRRAITTIDLASAVSGAHRAALNETYLEEEGGGAHGDSAAANKVPGVGPAEQPTKDDYELAANDEPHDIEDEQGHPETP